MKLTGENYIKSLEAEIQRYRDTIKDRYERIGRGETDMDDCFVSQRSNETAITTAQYKIDILKRGGLWDFMVLVDSTGQVVCESTGEGKYGPFWWVKDSEAFGRRHVPYHRRYEPEQIVKHYAKYGLKLEKREFPAWVTLRSNGKGMFGAYMAQPSIFRSRMNYYTGEHAE